MIILKIDTDYLSCINFQLRKESINWFSILQAIASLKELKKSAILSHLTEIGNKSLFEMFFDTNLGAILSWFSYYRFQLHKNQIYALFLLPCLTDPVVIP